MPSLTRTYADLSRPLVEMAFVVDATEAGRRLDAVLAEHYPWRSRTHFQRLVAAGVARLGGRSVRPSARVRAGDRVTVALPEDPTAPAQEVHDDLVLIHEDDDLVVVDKPSGLAVHPVGRIRHGTLINKLHARYRHPDPARDVVPRLGHRLDQDTSGVVLAVKNRETDVRITEAFTRRRVRKTYLALVRGVPAEPEGLIDAPLRPDPDGPTALSMRVGADGQPSRSRWRLLEALGAVSLLELEPLTGRTHQLRVHLAWAGHPILCDHLYGDPRPLYASALDPARPAAGDEPLLLRLALHAHRLELDHPRTGAPLVLESPLPTDLRHALDGLRAIHAAGAGGS